MTDLWIPEIRRLKQKYKGLSTNDLVNLSHKLIMTREDDGLYAELFEITLPYIFKNAVKWKTVYGFEVDEVVSVAFEVIPKTVELWKRRNGEKYLENQEVFVFGHYLMLYTKGSMLHREFYHKTKLEKELGRMEDEYANNFCNKITKKRSIIE